ncbi:MAG: cobyrinate a,c-diamide synthase, partial [Nitrospirae bacterium]
GESSSLNIARLLGIPVVLVLDVKSMAESAVLPVLGFKAVAADVRVAGLILNRVGSKRHLELVEKSLKKHCDVELLGFIPLSRAIQMPQRHLGLFTAEDGILTRDFLNELTGLVKQNVDINRLMDNTEITLPSSRLDSTGRKERLCKIAVARDRAFCFYYQDNLDMLERQGAELVYFSPLKDRTLPEADALYIGGGYPELYAEELSKNQSMLEDVRAFSYSGRPVYAECGGFMYLSKGILVNQNERYPMAGVYPVWTRLKTKRASLGYREVMLNEDTIIGKKGSLIRGHEFHYSEIIEPTDSLHNVYKNAEGFFVKNTLSSYIHIHFASNPEIVRSLINSAIKHRY